MSAPIHEPTDLADQVQMQWGVRIALRDGVRLHGTLYLPRHPKGPAAAIVTLTPYIAQTYHDRGIYFAAHGYPFLIVDVRGRGNSEGEFKPFINEGPDGYDVVEWLAGQRFCNGQVAMWGASYAGHAQWSTAKERPPHLVTIVPVASVFLGFDFPTRANIAWPYLMQWLTLVSGRTSQDKLFWGNESFWASQFRRLFESGTAFSRLDQVVGNPSAVFQEWVAHPHRDAYWDQHNPSGEQYGRLSLPILTITGSYDNAQLGALMHYREHLKNCRPAERSRHYLVIGPWDHAGTRVPQSEFGGLRCGPASLLDLSELHLQWYAWTVQGGRKPPFLQGNVAYYVMEADRWRYADTLEAVTREYQSLYLDSSAGAAALFASGRMTPEFGTGHPDTYVYDPRDCRTTKSESSAADPCCLRPTFPTDNVTDQKPTYAREGCELIYHSGTFQLDTEISGFFKLSAWLSIDQPDTDFAVAVYEVTPDGRSVLLSADSMRARYRDSLYEEHLVQTTEPVRYDFERFTFVARLLKKGGRLRLVIGPNNSLHSQKNYNSGGVVAEESFGQARTVSVKLFHDRDHPSALYVPLGWT